MPLLLTPAQPFQTTAHLEVDSVYALIRRVSYDTDNARIEWTVSYYASEAARVARAEVLQINALPLKFSQPATPEEANGVPIFQFLEQVLTAQLTPLLGEGATIENVP